MPEDQNSKVCRVCGERFADPRKSKKACSRACSGILRRHYKDTKTCVLCGTSFIATNKRYKRCPDCHKKHPGCLTCGKPLAQRGLEFCGHTCASAWTCTETKVGLGQRFFPKRCTKCNGPFFAASGRRLRCPACSKCKQCGKQLGLSGNDYCSYACRGKSITKPMGPAERRKRAQARRAAGINIQKGRPRPYLRGPLNPAWAGGTCSERQIAMRRVEYKIWRQTVFKRDGFACAICASTDKIEANHIYRWKTHPEKRYDVSNGITLCASHHKAIHGKEDNFIARFSEWVQTQSPVTLTNTEQLLLKPYEVECFFCHRVFHRSLSGVKSQTYDGIKKKQFCNRECLRKHEATLPHHRVNGQFVNNPPPRDRSKDKKQVYVRKPNARKYTRRISIGQLKLF